MFTELLHSNVYTSQYVMQVSCLAYSSTFEMEVIRSSNMLITFTWLHSITSQKLELFIYFNVFGLGCQ
jgi:hypothetical protein